MEPITVDEVAKKITVSLGGKNLTYETDYTIIEVPNNPKKGTAKYYVKGINEYGGMKTFKISIKARNFIVAVA